MAVLDVQLHRIIEGAGLHCVLPDLARNTERHRVRGDLCVVGHHGAGRDKCAESDVCTVKDHAARADEAVVFNRTALKMSVMADNAAVSNSGWMLSRAVNDRAILNGGLRANGD